MAPSEPESVAASGPPVVVPDGQGPDWITHFVLDPPGWVNPSLQFLAGVVALVVAYRLYQRDFRISLSTQIEMQRVVTHVLGVMVAALALVTYLDLAFWWDAAGGVALGSGGALAAQAAAARLPDETPSTDPRERVMAGWLALTVAGLILPELAGLQQSGYLAVNARWYVVGLSAVMALYDGALIQRDVFDESGGR